MSRYSGEPEFQHGSDESLGVLVTNLGTPDAPTASALRRYLAEFLWDPRVVELPRPLWWLILNGIILQTRPGRSAAAYRQVWGAEGSPLLCMSRRQSNALQEQLSARLDIPVHVALGMRYGNPSISDALEQLRRHRARRVAVLPLYPQYSGATVGSTFDAVAKILTRWRWVPELRFINHYHDHPDYIAAMANSIREHWEQHGRNGHLLLSFHGVPKRYLLAGDPYHCQCYKSARLIAAQLELEEGEWEVAFQSRFGREEWLRPYTDERLKALPHEGRRSVDVVCPGFSADCLETLEEIGLQNQELFLDSGGDAFAYIPALNDRPSHIELLTNLVQEHVEGWFRPESSDALAASREQALRVGAER